MSRKREFLYRIEAENDNGTTRLFNIYKQGGSYWIDDHLVHPSASSLEDEIRIVFHAKALRKIMPGDTM